MNESLVGVVSIPGVTDCLFRHTTCLEARGGWCKHEVSVEIDGPEGFIERGWSFLREAALKDVDLEGWIDDKPYSFRIDHLEHNGRDVSARLLAYTRAPILHPVLQLRRRRRVRRI